MQIGPRRLPHLCLRNIIVMLTLVSHLMATFGFPVPTPSSRKSTDGVPYPCQSRPCGCLSSEQCWSGDCCCFTLQEKLAWAEAHGVEPPEHVRKWVELRKSPPATPKKSCCSEIDLPSKPSLTIQPVRCCECEQETSAAATCCSEKPTCDLSSAAECPHCKAKPRPNCCERNKTQTTQNSPRVRWVLGFFAQKCCGKPLAALFQLDPAIVPNLTSISLPQPEPCDYVVPRSERTTSPTYCPPTPPPRS